MFLLFFGYRFGYRFCASFIMVIAIKGTQILRSFYSYRHYETLTKTIPKTIPEKQQKHKIHQKMLEQQCAKKKKAPRNQRASKTKKQAKQL